MPENVRLIEPVWYLDMQMADGFESGGERRGVLGSGGASERIMEMIGG